MKKIAYLSIFLITGFAFSQEKPRSMSETTETKTVKVNNGKEVIENKVKVTTREEKEIKLDKKDAGKVDQDMVIDDEKKVVREIEIDNDKDPFYDSKLEMVTYVRDGKEYSFVRNESGFDVSATESDEMYGNAFRSNYNKNYYIFNSNENSGVGYFNKKGNFVIEYYSPENKKVMTKEFVNNKKRK